MGKDRSFLCVYCIWMVLISLLLRYQTLRIWWKPSFSPENKTKQNKTTYTLKSQHTTLGDSQTLKSKPCIVSIDSRGIWESTELEPGQEIDHSREDKHPCKLAALSPSLTSSSSLTAPPGSWPAGCRWAHLLLPWGNSARRKGKWTIWRGSAAEWWPAWKRWRV